MKKYTLPQYYVIKRDENNPLWKVFIDYMNKIYNKNWEGDNYNYYGFDSTSSCNNFITHFKNNPTIITLEQWKSSFEEEFVLPENWCILRTKDNYKKVNEYFNTLRCDSPYEHYINYMNSDIIQNSSTPHATVELQKNYTEITTGQFIKYVYNPTFKKENTMEVKLTREFLDKAYNAAKNKSHDVVNMIHNEVNAFELTTTQAFIDRMKKRFKNCSEWSAILEKEFSTKKEIEWDKIKTGSVVMINNSLFNNFDIKKEVNIVFYNSSFCIPKGLDFHKSDKIWTTFYQDKKYYCVLNLKDYITEIISY